MRNYVIKANTNEFLYQISFHGEAGVSYMTGSEIEFALVMTLEQAELFIENIGGSDYPSPTIEYRYTMEDLLEMVRQLENENAMLEFQLEDM